MRFPGGPSTNLLGFHSAGVLAPSLLLGGALRAPNRAVRLRSAPGDSKSSFVLTARGETGP